MPLIVSFQRPAGAGDLSAAAIGFVRASESIEDAGTGALTARDGEIAVILNTEAAAISVAHGSTPSAAASVATNATSAAYTIPPGVLVPVVVGVGDKFSTAF